MPYIIGSRVVLKEHWPLNIPMAVSEMADMCGKVVTITNVYNFTQRVFYEFKEYHPGALWPEEVVECLAYEKFCPMFCPGDIVVVRYGISKIDRSVARHGFYTPGISPEMVDCEGCEFEIERYDGNACYKLCDDVYKWPYWLLKLVSHYTISPGKMEQFLF